MGDDVFGRRIAKRHYGQTTTFVWDGDVIALEKTAEQTRHYLFEAGSFVPLAQVVEKGSDSNTAYYHVDHLGTPQLLTDEDGEVAWSAEYKAWGAAKAAISDAAQSAGIDNPLRFQGQYFDAESGLHYNRHRYYDPETGRFISSDPIGLLGGLNTHAYAPNPVGWVDPLGLSRKGIQVPTSTGKGSSGIIYGENIPDGVQTGLSTRAGGSGITNPVVQDLYDQVPAGQRSFYHGKCVEGQALSKIADKTKSTTAEELKAVTKGSKASVYNSKGTYMPACKSCAHVLKSLEIESCKLDE